MPYSSQHAKDKVGESIDRLVREYNAKYSTHPIVVFQFVSLDGTTNKNLIWWSHDQAEVSEKYNKIVTEFIGKEKVERTLVTWEYDEDVYRYASFGPGKILLSVNPENFIPGKTPDKIDLEEIYQLNGDKNSMLFHWEQLLKNEFKNGSTMWVSLPHADRLNRLIYSSVFVLFNTQLPEKKKKTDKKILLDSYRIFRNFIVQYLIDHYRRPIIENNIELTRELTGFKNDLQSTNDSFKPIKYNVSGEKITTHIKALEKQYFSSQHYNHDFVLLMESARKRIKETYNSSRHKIDQTGCNYHQFTYTNVGKIHPGDKEKFKFFIYGRFMILTYHLVLEFSLKDSWHYLIDRKSPMFDFSELQKRFAIDGLRNDITSATGQHSADINLHKVIPCISEAEFRFLLDVCDDYEMAYRWNDINEARKLNS